MNLVEYLTELMNKDVKLIVIAENDVNAMKLNIGEDIKRAEEKCDTYEELYEGDNELIMSAYIEYEKVRSPLTELESVLCDFNDV